MEYRYITGFREGSKLLYIESQKFLYRLKSKRGDVQDYICYQSILAKPKKNQTEKDQCDCGARVRIHSDGLCEKIQNSKHTRHNNHDQIVRGMEKSDNIKQRFVKSKMIMQDIWHLKEVDWDNKVPESIEKEWLELYANLPLLTEFKIKRWLKTNRKNETQIHGFCDASGKAYGTGVYIRVVDENDEISCVLLSAKSRVAPLNTVSIPRLELLAAVMLSEQIEAIVEACEFQEKDITLWSDSTVVLSWIKKEPHELKAFVGNRIATIQEKTKLMKWKHIRTNDNPADLVRRGMKMQDFLKSKEWLEGPSWLKQKEALWPESKMIVTSEAKEEVMKECKKQCDAQTFFMTSGKDHLMLYNKFQSWDTLINVTAYVLRLCHGIMMRNIRKGNAGMEKRFLTSDERNKAVEFRVKFEQSKTFRKEIECIKNENRLRIKSDINSLRPILDEKEILRVGGRIDKANMAYERKHQYIIPHKSRLSYLLLKHAHEATMHGGAQLMIHFLRKKFWIPKLRAEAKQYINTCVQCIKQAQKTADQIIGQLPRVRLRPAPAFQNVGVDMAGPYRIKAISKLNTNTRGRNLPDTKGWITVFVCLVTRAVHLEVANGMSSDDFLDAYQRFTSRRGNPEIVYSDNGTNFIGANREIQKAYEIWKTEQIQHYVHAKGTEWNFITPSAPNEGGIWEAAVKSMKHHLKRVMGTQSYSFQGMSTLTSSVEACLNSRPLCSLSDDHEDMEALTPAHFLIGRSLKLPMHEKADKPPYNIKRLFLQKQFQIQAFWKQWSNDYLQALSQLPKWREEQDNLRVGQLVVIKTDNVPPTYWAMGRIKQTHAGSD
ncbi:uncharacterized protein LOC116347212, partial [Contarinia nasturtii]|uniref:uncharacterized protein LOC116347212 n=1 Tax=Contarinia nasturtii TaxID=265458 RepID=UPI0012D3B282